MASNRHLGRIVALQTLYELDFRIGLKEENLDRQAVLDRNIARYSEVVGDQAFVADLVNGVLKEAPQIDILLQPLAPEWPIDQIARVDRVVLRMGVWEMQHSDNVPVRVVINEAVELAKEFGADNASKFVNGVLGSAVKQLGISTDEAPQTPQKKKRAVKKPAATPTPKPPTTKQTGT